MRFTVRPFFLAPGIILDSCRVGQMNPVVLAHQSIDDPIPVEGRFDGNPLQLIPIGSKRMQNCLNIVSKLSFFNDLSVSSTTDKKFEFECKSIPA